MENDELIRAARLADPVNFDRRFNEHITTQRTYIDAWKAVEAEYQAVFGKPKYSSYDSYRISRGKRIHRL